MATEQTMKEINASLDELEGKSTYLEELEAIMKLRLRYKSLDQSIRYQDDEGLKDWVKWLKNDLVKLNDERENVPMKGGRFLRIPKGYELVNENEAKNCDGAAIIPTFNGEQLELPTFVYFYKKCDEDEHIYDSIEGIMAELYPAYSLALYLDHQQKTFKGHRIMTIVHLVKDAESLFEVAHDCFNRGYISELDLSPYFVAIYNSGDSDATTHEQN